MTPGHSVSHAHTALLLSLLAALLEAGSLQLVRRRHGDWRACLAATGERLQRCMLNRYVGFCLAAGFLALLAQHRVAAISMQQWWSWPLLIVAQDFCYYWLHRADHRERRLWAMHALQHCRDARNFSAAYRLGWTSGVSGSVLFFAPLLWCGFPPLAVLGAVALNLLYRFCLRIELLPRLGPLQWLFNTPHQHRMHLAGNPECVDRNFGGMLIVFDRLFGTHADKPLGRLGWTRRCALPTPR